MGRLVAVAGVGLSCAVLMIGLALAQGRGPTDWMTANSDAQRSSWVRNDAKISRQKLSTSGFQLLWKLQLNNKSRGLNSLTPPSLLERLIGYRGFRMLGFVGGSSDKVIVIDTDLGRLEWERQLTRGVAAVGSSRPSSLSCPGGMTAAVTRPTTLVIAPAPNPSGGGGRSNPARSAVGEPGKGAVTLLRPTPTPARPTPTPTPTPVPPRVNAADPPGGQFGAGPFLIHALSSDGMFHSMHLSNGADYEPPTRFLPPDANASGLIVVENRAYVTTQNGCGGVADGMWMLDLVTKQVKSWKASIAGSAGAAFGPDGTIYVTTGSRGESSNSVVALDGKTLEVRDWYRAGNLEFSSSPVIFEFRRRVLLSVASADGRLHLLDTGSLGGSDHKTPLATAVVSTKGTFAPGALASWQDATRTRWILAPGVASATGTANGTAVGAWRISEEGGALRLQLAWTSRELTAPLPPTVINDVVFVTSGGEAIDLDRRRASVRRGQRSSSAVIYALDAITGTELWSSGTAITSFTRSGALAGGVGQIYLGTHSGELYAFGFPMEH